MRRWSAAWMVAVAFVLVAGVVAASAAPSYHVVARWPKPTWHMGPVPSVSSPLVAPAVTYGSGLGVAMTADGTTFVCDTYNSRVLKFAASGEFLLSFDGAGQPGGQFKKPQGIALDAAGSAVYVADTGNHRVQKYSAAGAYMDHWGKEGGSDFAGSGQGEFRSPEGIAVDQSGYVYVADTQNQRVQKFSSQGTYQDMWGAPGTGPSLFYAPSGIAVAPDGTLWTVDRDSRNSLVQHFTNQGEYLGLFGGAASYLNEPSLFKETGGIAIDSDGYLWITDNPIIGPRIQRFDSTGQLALYVEGRKLWNDFADDGKPGLQKLGGIVAFKTGGAVHVVAGDQGKSQLREFDDVGSTMSFRGSWGKGHRWLADPGGVAVGPGGDVYVADTVNHRVQKFGADGTFQTVLPKETPAFKNTQLGRFDTPQGVAVTAHGDVFVIEAGNNRVQKLTADLGLGDPTKASVYAWGSGPPNTGDGYFNAPSAIAAKALDATTDRVFVADTNNNRVQIFDLTHGTSPSLTFVGKWGPNMNPNPLLKPGGIALAPDGSVYVADTDHNRVIRFSAGGTVLKTWGSVGSGNGQFQKPHGLACDSAGNVYVADTDNSRIQVFTAEGGYLSQFGTMGSDEGELYKPRGISVGEDGIAYVADSGNHRVQAFAPPVTVSITGVTDGTFYNHGVTPAVAFIGPQITASSITLNSSPWTPVPLTAEGSYTLSASASNALGDSDSKTVQFGIDMTLPSTASDGVASYDDTATINLTPSDDRSGVASTWYRLDGGAPTKGTAIVVTKAGDHTLSYWSVDKAGNSEAPKDHAFAVVDTKPPVTTSDAQPTYVTSATIHLTPSDSSGVKQTLWKLDGGAETSGTVITTKAYGLHTLEFWSIDTSDRVETKNTVTFRVLRKTSATLTKSATTVGYGGTVTLKGSLRTDTGALLKGKTVRIIRTSDGVHWSVFQTLTSATGYYSTSFRLQQSTYYRLAFAGDTTWAACTAPTQRVLARAYLTTPYAVSSVKRGGTFRASGYLKPRHEAGTAAVKLYCYRYERGAWILRKTVTLYAQDYADASGTYTKYTGTLSLPYAGSWRMRAYHGDANHAATYSGYRAIAVK